MRALTGRPTVVRFFVEDETGSPVTATGTVNVRVTNGAGEEVGEGAASAESPGVYRFSFSPPEELDTLTAVATVPTSDGPMTLMESVELVSARVFRLADLRAEGVPGDKVAALEELVAHQVTQILGYPPVLTGKRAQFRVTEERTRLLVSHLFPLAQVYAISRDGVDLGAARVAAGGVLELESGATFLPGLYLVHVAVGVPDIPADLSAACLALAKYRSKQVKWDPRTTRIMSEGGEVYLARQGADRPTGYPDVDYVLASHRKSPTIVAV